MNEVQRIKDAYSRRSISKTKRMYSAFNPSALFAKQQREKELLAVLNQYGFNELSGKRILDIGCGEGVTLRDFENYGARPEDLYGVDILPDRIKTARNLSPNIDFKVCNAAVLPFDSESLDIVLVFTVLTSILDDSMKENMAREMLRVLHPEGIIIWYDYHFNNPQNPDVRGITRKEIYKLFRGCTIRLKKITLAPPLTRAIAPYSYLLCYLLEKLVILNTHYLGVIRKDSPL